MQPRLDGEQVGLMLDMGPRIGVRLTWSRCQDWNPEGLGPDTHWANHRVQINPY